MARQTGRPSKGPRVAVLLRIPPPLLKKLDAWPGAADRNGKVQQILTDRLGDSDEK